MRTYTDTLRDQTAKPEQPRYLVAPGEPPEITNDPKLRAAREKLIRQMVGIAWADRTALQKVRWVLFCAFSWLAATVGFGVFAFIALLVFSGVTGIPPGQYDPTTGRCPPCEFVVGGAFVIGMIASTVFLAWALPNREREIHRLRGLPNEQLIREAKVWQEQMRRLAEEQERRRDLDYQAERIGYWTDYYSRRG